MQPTSNNYKPFNLIPLPAPTLVSPSLLFHDGAPPQHTNNEDTTSKSLDRKKTRHEEVTEQSLPYLEEELDSHDQTAPLSSGDEDDKPSTQECIDDNEAVCLPATATVNGLDDIRGFSDDEEDMGHR